MLLHNLISPLGFPLLPQLLAFVGFPKMNHVFFVFSPFHMALTNKIIESREISNYIVILCHEGDDKSISYAQSLFVKDRITILKINKRFGVLCLLNRIYRLSKNLGKEDLVVHTASPKSLWFRFFFSNLAGCASFNVMDDGVGVLDMGGYFSKPDSLMKTILLRLLLVNDNYLKFLEKIDVYYAFYGSESIFDRFCSRKVMVKPLFISEADSREGNKLENFEFDPIRIFLTGPFSERGFTSKNVEMQLYEKVVKRFGIHFLIKHPSESAEKYRDRSFSFLETRLYAEQVIELLSKDRRVELYSFSSSVLVNLNGAYNVKVYCLDCSSIPAMSVHKALNISILRLENED